VGTSLTEVAEEAFHIAIAFVGEHCLDPADPATVVIMQGYLEVN